MGWRRRRDVGRWVYRACLLKRDFLSMYSARPQKYDTAGRHDAPPNTTLSSVLFLSFSTSLFFYRLDGAQLSLHSSLLQRQFQPTTHRHSPATRFSPSFSHSPTQSSSLFASSPLQCSLLLAPAWAFTVECFLHCVPQPWCKSPLLTLI